MAYQGAAYRLDYAERAYGRDARLEFDVIQGGGVDAEVRRGVSYDFLALARLAAFAIILFVALGAARVIMTTYTVQCLRANVSIRSSIERAESVNSELRVERSVLSSSSRICRIAMQNYGMVHATSHDPITIPVVNDGLEAGEGEPASVTEVTSQASEGEPATAGNLNKA